MTVPTNETLVSVAIVRNNGQVYSGGFKSHGELRASLGDEDPYAQKPRITDLEGFLTSMGRFVTRAEAVHVGVASGQLRPEWLKVGRPLLSSDIW